MPSLTSAYNWAIRTCNAANIGYSQELRNAQIYDGITYYDCSSFIWYALKNGGFNVSGSPFTTANMASTLRSLGFRTVSVTSEWKPGDILWRSGHTEMVYTDRITMGAHTDTVSLADQVSINDFSTDPSYWTTCYRYADGGITSLNWIKGNRYLGSSEMENNAYIIYSYLYARGWTLNAICGLLGNMETESTINPGIWQSLNEGNMSGGYGLVQWTPATNWTNYADSIGCDWDDGNAQLNWIDTQTVPTGQWIPTDSYPISFEEFKTSEQSVEYLASAFLHNFERPGVPVELERQQDALTWYAYLKDLNPDIPGSGWVKKKTGYNFLLFNKQRRRYYQNGKK